MDWEKFEAEQKQLWQELLDSDNAAKKTGTLVGRYLKEAFADGYAYYRIVKVTSRTAHLVHVPLGDAWRIPFIESLGCKVPLAYVKDNVGKRDWWQEVCNKNKK